MKVCYILCYYFPQYVRTQTLIDGLGRIEGMQIHTTINRKTGWWRYIEALSKLALVRLTQRPDFYILGFRGYETYWPVRLLTWGKPLILDHMMSPYDSLLHEKKRVKPGGLVDKLIYHYERGILRNASGVLTDTINHQRFFAQLFRLDESRFHPVYVSADENLFRPVPTIRKKSRFQIFFYGSFLPLHGVRHVLSAATLLRDLPVEFHLVGGHKTDLNQFHRQISRMKLANVVHTPWIEYYELPNAIAQADLCLGGPFGNTGQAQRIITGKTYQFLAMAKPTVVGRIEPNQGFVDKHNCLLVPQADAQALANAIRWAFSNQDALADIATQGHALYQERFSTYQISQTLKDVIHEILSA